MKKDYDYGLELLHAACNSFAPNAQAQQGFASARRKMEQDGEPVHQIAASMAAALALGISLDWPASLFVAWAKL